MSSPPGAAEVAGVVARLRADVAELLALDLAEVDGVNGPELHRALSTAAGQVQTVAARVLARVEDDGRWAASGWRTFGEWASRKQGASFASVRRDSVLGHALDGQLPGTRVAVEAGAVSIEHAQLLARYGPTTPARIAALASDEPGLNEIHLVTQASRQSPDEFSRTVRRWAASVDAAAAETEHEAASAREYLTVTRRPDGVALAGFLTHEHGEAVAIALRAVAGVPTAGDERSREERQAAALVDASRLVLDRGLAGGGQSVRPHLSVLVSWETLERQTRRAAAADGEQASQWLPAGRGAGAGAGAPAETVGGTLLTRAVLDRLACDSEISRVVFGPAGEVLDVGRARRTYTGQQRRAVIARDGSCRYPGCGAPVLLGEVHHVVSWAHGGKTSIENGLLLCWFHHDLVHRRRIRIARARGGGGWEFTRDDGTRLDGVPVRRAAGTGGGAEAGSATETDTVTDTVTNTMTDEDPGPPASESPGVVPSSGSRHRLTRTSARQGVLPLTA